MILAEAGTDFPWQYVGWLFVGLAAVAVCLNQIDDFFDRRKPKIPEPQRPPNEQLESSLSALAEQLREHQRANNQEHRDLFSKIGGVERGAQAKLELAINSGNVSREKLHGRMNSFGDTIGALRGQMEILIQKLK